MSPTGCSRSIYPKRASVVLSGLLSKAAPGPPRAGLGARLARARLQEGDPAGALTALSASADPELPPALAEERALLLARASAATGDLSRALAVLAALATPAADDARASLLEGAKEWAAAERALADLVAKTVPPDGRAR